MKSIGLRATPSEVWYAIIDKADSKDSELSLIRSGKIVVPHALSVPHQLNHLRSTFKDIIREENVEQACIRVTESNARSLSIQRISIEAILQELFCSTSIKKYLVGNIASISAKLGFPRENFKKYISKELDFASVPGWSKFRGNEKESILSAIAATEI